MPSGGSIAFRIDTSHELIERVQQEKNAFRGSRNKWMRLKLSKRVFREDKTKTTRFGAFLDLLPRFGRLFSPPERLLDRLDLPIVVDRDGFFRAILGVTARLNRMRFPVGRRDAHKTTIDALQATEGCFSDGGFSDHLTTTLDQILRTVSPNVFPKGAVSCQPAEKGSLLVAVETPAGHSLNGQSRPYLHMG